MIKTIVFGLLVLAVGLGGWLTKAGTPTRSALVKEPVANSTTAVSRREHMARLVAETAAVNAEKTARAALAKRKMGPQETAAR